MKFEIESGIPIPKGAGRKPKYPFGEMKVGDSFIFSHRNYSRELQRKAGCAARNYKDKSPGKSKWKFTARREGQKIRIWRIK